MGKRVSWPCCQRVSTPGVPHPSSVPSPSVSMANTVASSHGVSARTRALISAAPVPGARQIPVSRLESLCNLSALCTPTALHRSHQPSGLQPWNTEVAQARRVGCPSHLRVIRHEDSSDAQSAPGYQPGRGGNREILRPVADFHRNRSRLTPSARWAQDRGLPSLGQRPRSPTSPGRGPGKWHRPCFHRCHQSTWQRVAGLGGR
jgi:hypothetical protein